MATKHKLTRPEDCATAWFCVLEIARLDGNTQRAAEAQAELQRLGVHVTFRIRREREVSK